MTQIAKKIIIVGAGEHGQVVKNCLRLLSDFEFAGFLDDTKSGEDILGGFADFENFLADHLFYIAVGNNRDRKAVFEKFHTAGAKFATIIHPTATLELQVKLGVNVFMGAHTYININTIVGDNTIINNGCIVEHDNIIGSHSHLTPGVVTGGGAKIGNNVLVGLNCSIRDHITIGDNCIIGMGTVVVKDLEGNLQILNKFEQIKKHL